MRNALLMILLVGILASVVYSKPEGMIKLPAAVPFDAVIYKGDNGHRNRITNFKVTSKIPLNQADYKKLEEMTEGTTVVTKSISRKNYTRRIICPISKMDSLVKNPKYNKIINILKKYE